MTDEKPKQVLHDGDMDLNEAFKSLSIITDTTVYNNEKLKKLISDALVTYELKSVTDINNPPTKTILTEGNNNE